MQSHWSIELGAAIRRRRRALKLTQIALSELAAVGPDFVYDAERGKPTLRIDKLVALLEVLGMRLVLEPGKGSVRIDDRLRGETR